MGFIQEQDEFFLSLRGVRRRGVVRRVIGSHHWEYVLGRAKVPDFFWKKLVALKGEDFFESLRYFRLHIF